MATIASLVVNLTTETASFAAGMDKAAGMADTGAKRITMALAGIKFPGAAVFAAATAGMAAVVKSGIDAADAMHAMSQQAGISTEKLSAMDYAAGMSGLATEDLVSSIAKLSKGMYAAADGSGSVGEGLAALGIKVKGVDGQFRGADSVIEDVADRFAKMDDGVQKTAIAMQIFGKSGASMIPLLNEGRSGLQRMADEAERAGVVIDSKTAAAADQFNDNLDRLGKTMSGLAIKLSGPVVEALNSLADGFARAQGKGESFLSSVGAGLNAMIAGSADRAELAKLTHDLTQLREQMDKVNQIKGLNLFGGRLFDTGPSDAQVEKYGELVKKISLLRAKIAGHGEESKPATAAAPAISETADAAARARDKIDGVIASLKFEEAQLGRTSVQQEIYNRLNDAGVAANTKKGAQIAALVVQIDAERTAQEELNKRMEEGAKMGEDMVQAYYDRQASLGDQVESMRQSTLSPAAAEMEDYTARLAVLDEFYQGKADKQAEYQALFEALTYQHNQNLSAMDMDRQYAVSAAEDSIMQRRYDAANMTADLLMMVAGKSKIAAFAAIALQKGVAIAQIIANGASASIAALAPPPLGLGPVAGAPLAASIKLWTGVQAALVGATGIAQFAGAGGGASGSGIPSPRGGLPSVGGADSGQAAAEPPQTVVTIALRDDQIFSGSAVRTLIEKINDALGDGAKLATA